jgi:hypothetical protein
MTTAIGPRPSDRLPAVAGHVDVERCIEQRLKADRALRLEVLDGQPGSWIVIAWEPIPPPSR